MVGWWDDGVRGDGMGVMHSNRSPARHRDSIVSSLFDSCIDDFDNA